MTFFCYSVMPYSIVALHFPNIIYSMRLVYLVRDSSICCVFAQAGSTIQSELSHRFLRDMYTKTDQRYVHVRCVCLCTLDIFCTENNVCPVLMKIDAEGFDEQVLLGSSNLLMNTKFNALIIEGNSELVKKTMDLASFLPYSYNPFKRTFELGGNHGSNQLYIRDIELANQRVLNASKVSILNFTI